MPQLLQPHFNHQFAGVIWRMELDPEGGLLALEIRNEKDKQVSFAVVDTTSAQVTLKSYTTEERWMAGLEGIFNGVLLLHYYKSAGSPEHKGIMAVDARTGNTLWSNYNLAFHHFSINGPVVYDARLQPRTLQLADISTGNITRQFVQGIDTEAKSNISLPVIVNDTSDMPQAPFGNIAHRLLYKQYIIVSLHTQAADGGLEQKLFIMHKGETVYADLLNTGIQKLQPEAFMLHNNHLIYLKDRSQLKIINL